MKNLLECISELGLMHLKYFNWEKKIRSVYTSSWYCVTLAVLGMSPQIHLYHLLTMVEQK